MILQIIMRGDLTVGMKKNNSGEIYIIIVAILFSLLMFSLFIMSSCSNKENNNATPTQIVTSTAKDYGTEYRYVNVLSNGKSIWQLKGTIGVVVDGDTVVITTSTGKQHIFVNADVIIKQIDKNETSKSETSKKEESSKVEESKVNEESSRLTSESSISQTSNVSTVSQASYTSSVASH